MQFDATGNFYTLASSGTSPTFTYTVDQVPITSFDANGLPLYGSPTQIASWSANIAAGYPQATDPDWSYFPTTDGTIPYFEASVNTAVARPANAFHMGFIKSGSTSPYGWSMPQNWEMQYPDGDGSFTADTNIGNTAQIGGATAVLNNDIFAMVNGNYSQFACQLFMYRDDMPIGQFGYQGSYAYQPVIGYGPAGTPQKVTNSPLAPGFCGDVFAPHVAQVGSTYVLVTGDESYHEGTHVWTIDPSTITFYEGSASLGSDVTLSNNY